MAKLGLRLRVALFFFALATGALGFVVLGLWMGFARLGGEPGGFLVAGVVAGFGIFGLTAGIWLLFDENVAKPVIRLAADLRSRAHADVNSSLDETSMRYLDDLGPAANALSARLGIETLQAAERVAAETARLTAERERLTAVLSEIPLAVIMVSDDHRVVLYDGQAANALEPVRPLCLGQSVFSYLEEAQIRRALPGLEQRATVPLTLSTVDGTRVFDVTLQSLGDGAGYLLSLHCEPDPRAERPLAFHFDPGMRPERPNLRETPLLRVAYVVFDTETTGLLPEQDEVVQMGAVRAIGDTLIESEVFDAFVNPGRPIPATSTKVHGIDDAMVADAPSMEFVGARFLQFAEGAVLVAHNAPFDMAFLRRHARIAGTPIEHPVLDTVLLAAELFGAADPLTLDAIAERLDVAIPGEVRHSALGDARATAAVFLKMLSVFRAQGHTTLGALLDLQAQHVSRLGFAENPNPGG